MTYELIRTPPYLKKGDCVGIITPAKVIAKEPINNALSLLKSWGLNVVLGKHIFDSYNQFAGKDEDRAFDLQCFINDPLIKAIICSRGGYGCIRTLEYLDFTPLTKNPKWLVGYSDVTVYHTLLNCNIGLETLHATMPINFPMEGENSSTLSLRKALFGELDEYVLPSNYLNIIGKTKGRIVGGNLSIIQSVACTKADIITDDSILFIEEVDEYLYHIDRMMMNLKCSGKLNKIKGLIVGGMTDIKDSEIPFGKNVYELIRNYVADFNIPCVFGFPAGHEEPNLALYFGRDIELEVNEQQIHLSFS